MMSLSSAPESFLSCPGWSRTTMVVFTMDRSFCAPALVSSSAGTSGFASTLAPSTSGRSWRDEERFTKVFSRDLAPTEIVEALEADRLMELASLDFRPTETSEDFLEVGFVLAAGSASLEARLVLFLLVTLTEDVVLTSFCSFDSFRVFAAVCFARVVEEEVLNSCCCSFPLALLLLLA